jgi:hypothetical protein
MSTIRFQGLRKPRSHVVWFKTRGYWPPKGAEIDHRDGNHGNNDPANLRIATKPQNNFNRVSKNPSGEKNVVFDRASHSWQVKIKAEKTKVHANASHKISAIVAARLIRRTLHGEFALDNRK